VRACACVRARVRVYVPELVCARTGTRVCVHACTRAVRGNPPFGPCVALPLLAVRAGAGGNSTRRQSGTLPQPSHGAHTWLASLSWRGFGCSSAAESRPRPSSVAVCYQIGRRCVAFTRQPVRTHRRPHPPQAPVAALGLTFVTGTGAVFCFRSSIRAPGIVSSPRTTGVHPASTRMQTSAMTVGGGVRAFFFAGYPQPLLPEKANRALDLKPTLVEMSSRSSTATRATSRTASSSTAAWTSTGTTTPRWTSSARSAMMTRSERRRRRLFRGFERI
jgi:hypothetical protein